MNEISYWSGWMAMDCSPGGLFRVWHQTARRWSLARVHSAKHAAGGAGPEAGFRVRRSRQSARRGPVYRIGRLLWRTATAFFDDNIGQLGAALAFYTTIAVAPLLVLAIAVAGLVFQGDNARQRIIGEIQSLAGTAAGQAIAALQSPAATATGKVATILGAATLLFGAFGVFQHLQDALNAIWRTQPPQEKGVWRFVRRRLFSIATVMATGFLLLVSLIASAGISWFGARASQLLSLPPAMLEAGNFVVSLTVVTFLFGMIFKLLPDTPVPWRHVWFGAALTSALFTIGKTFLGWYLGRAGVTSAYGAAGSLVALLLWCYYMAQIVFFGAEFTRVATVTDGGRDFTRLPASRG